MTEDHSRIFKPGGHHPRPLNTQFFLKDGSVLRTSGYGSLWFDGLAPLNLMAYGLEVWVDGESGWTLCGSLVDKKEDWLDGHRERCPDSWLDSYSYIFRKQINGKQIYLGAARIPHPSNPQLLIPSKPLKEKVGGGTRLYGSERLLMGPAYDAHILGHWAATLPLKLIHRVLHEGYAWKCLTRDAYTWDLSRFDRKNQQIVKTSICLKSSLKRLDYVVVRLKDVP